VLGDQRAGERRAQQVNALVNGPGLHGREHEIGQEFLAQIADVELAGAGLERLFLEPVQFFLLPQVRGEANHLAMVIFTQPRHNNGCIEAAAVGENYLGNRLHGGTVLS